MDWDQVIGGNIADDFDATTDDIHARQSTQSLVTQLELAVSILQQRKDQAEVALKDAIRLMAVEIEAAACARLAALDPRGEELLTAVTRFSIDVTAAGEGLRLASGT